MLINKLENEIREFSKKEDRTVRGLWGVDCLFNPPNNGRVFAYKFIIAQTVGQGCAYSTKQDYMTGELSRFVAKDFLDCDLSDIALRVAFFDSVYGKIFNQTPANSETVNGMSESKMKWRTDIIFKETQRLLDGGKDRKIVNIGVVGDILKRFSDEGYDVCGSDYDSSIAGTKLFGKVPVYNGIETMRLVAESDIAVVTGMTITTNTIDHIITCAKQNNTKILVFAETGSNLGGFFVRNGVDCYVGEEFPFYIFNGYSTINIHRG